MTNFGVVQPSICPYCGHEMDDAFGVEDRKVPQVGDLSICIKCTGVMVFDSRLGLESIPDSVWNSLPAGTTTTIRKAIAAIKELRA